MKRYQYLSRNVLEIAADNGVPIHHKLSIVSYVGPEAKYTPIRVRELTICPFSEEVEGVEFTDFSILINRTASGCATVCLISPD